MYDREGRRPHGEVTGPSTVHTTRGRVLFVPSSSAQPWVPSEVPRGKGESTVALGRFRWTESVRVKVGLQFEWGSPPNLYYGRKGTFDHSRRESVTGPGPW